MRFLLAWLLCFAAVRAAEEDPFAHHDREAWTKALEIGTKIASNLYNEAVIHHNDPGDVARCWSYANELREMLRKCNGNANAESIRWTKIELKLLDDYVEKQITTPPRKPRRE